MTYLSHTTSALFETLRFKSPLFLLLALLISFPALAAKKPIQIPSGKPEIFDLDPRGIQRGTTNRIKLIGTNLIGLTELKLHNSKLTGELLDDPPESWLSDWIEASADEFT